MTGTAILPAALAATARPVHSVHQAGYGYGYQWWRVDRGQPAEAAR